MTKTCPLNNNKCVESCMWFDTGFIDCKITYYIGELSKDIGDINSLLFSIEKSMKEYNEKKVVVTNKPIVPRGRPAKKDKTGWTEKQIKLLRENWGKVTKEELEQMIGKNWRQLTGKAGRLNLGAFDAKLQTE